MRVGGASQRQLLHILCRRFNTKPSAASYASTMTSSSPTEPSLALKNDLSIYGSLVEELKKPYLKQKFVPSIATKPFNEVDSHKQQVSEEDRKDVSWSSSYDPVTRSPFAKDVVHLQSLLDALLATKNFSRADNILRAIHPLLDRPSAFTGLLNKYLESYAQDESTTLANVESYFEKILKSLGVRANDRTYAVLIAKALQEDGDYMRFVYRATPRVAKRVFGHVDLISPEGLAVIFRNPSLQQHFVPQDLQPLYLEVRAPQTETKGVPDYFKDDEIDAPMVDKDMIELRSVDSFGLKVIRHTLLGLESKEELDLQKLFSNMDEDFHQHILHNTKENKKINYHEIFKLLKTPEDRAKFNEALDVFNNPRQRELESKGIDAAREKWKHEYEEMQLRGDMRMNKNLNVQLYQWYQDMLPYVEEEVRLCNELLNNEVDMSELSTEEKKLMKNRAFYAPYLVLIPPKKLSVITVLELLKLNSTGGILDGMRTARAVISVGKALELEYKSQNLVAADKKFFARKKQTPKRLRKFLRYKKNPNEDTTIETEWDYPVYAKLGSVLTSFLLHVAKVEVSGTDPTTGAKVVGKQPAFHHTYQFVNGQRLGIIKLHKKLIGQLASNAVVNSVQPQFLPMLIPPADWTGHNSGGYRFTPSPVVRIKDSAETIAYVKAASEADNLDEVFKGLNVLGRTAWTINAKVLEVISQSWNTGEEFLDIAPIIEEPKLPPQLPSDAEPLERGEYQRKVRHILNEAAALRSQRCDTNYKLEIARAFVGEKMYFPHNVDFRGRAYPLSPHLNHLGNDLTRSLFLFWEGKELGENGLRWLKIHLANVYGKDKSPLDERVAFVDENMENILESARDPLGTSRWWTKGDKPWQVLSVCYELAEANKLDDPTKFVSYIPVHQDGTCNGLQHYAALGGDIEGARQVNLIPADRPQDVYKFVAGLVEKRLEMEAEAGNKYAIFLKGNISRKVVKQTVMTNVYGVTFVGAVLQIEKQLSHMFHKDDYEKVPAYARYLTLLVFASIRELFEGAHKIQDWLGESAKRISKSVRIDYEEKSAKNANKPSHLSSVIWTTPLGLPCVQPYRATKKQIVSTSLQDITISDPFGATQVDARKQQTAFPPNFVHSLDATHMLMTSSACGDVGLDFASVHDSYWTHARDVDIMNVKIREQFVKLHEDNLIVKLRDEFERRYKGFLQVVSIPGDHEVAIKIREVRKNIVKDLGRALTVADEIYIEKKRQELLDSPDAREIQAGREMVTTVSVTEGYDMNALAVRASTSKSLQVLIPLTFPDIPERGDLDVQEVKKSSYFFS